MYNHTEEIHTCQKCSHEFTAWTPCPKCGCPDYLISTVVVQNEISKKRTPRKPRLYKQLDMFLEVPK